MDQPRTFAELLNEAIAHAGCSATLLSEKSGVSAASLSRYRAGSRIPEADSGAVNKLASALCTFYPDDDPLDEQTLLAAFEKAIKTERGEEADQLGLRFDMLCAALNINVSAMSRVIGFDSSFLSRLRSGQRRPAEPQAFAQSVAAYALRSADETTLSNIGMLTDIALETLAGENGTQALKEWLTDQGKKPAAPLNGFLNKLDEFDLNDFMDAIRFDQMKIPTTPFRLPTSKTYYGLEGMKRAEVDFLLATATSRSADDVIMCSDMPMEDMAKDVEFGKKWMLGLAALMKRGLRLRIVHNVNRPIAEMALGLESWIPLYMTGLVEPYYLKGHKAGIFERLDYVSGAASLKGENIQGHHANGRYQMEKSSKEIAYQRKRMETLLAKASPLMRIYRDDELSAYQRFMQTESECLTSIDSSAFKNISIRVRSGALAVIEKTNDPAIRFVIYHPQMVSAIERFAAPVIE